MNERPLINQCIDHIQHSYELNRPDEVIGERPLSKKAFQTLREEGLVPAFHGVCDFVREYGHTDLVPLKALGIIFGSSILTCTNLTQYVNTIRTHIQDEQYSIPQKIGLALYGSSVGMIMTGHSPAQEEDSSYGVTHDIDGTPIIIHGGGRMTRKEAEKAINKGFF